MRVWILEKRDPKIDPKSIILARGSRKITKITLIRQDFALGDACRQENFSARRKFFIARRRAMTSRDVSSHDALT